MRGLKLLHRLSSGAFLLGDRGVQRGL